METIKVRRFQRNLLVSQLLIDCTLTERWHYGQIATKSRSASPGAEEHGAYQTCCDLQKRVSLAAMELTPASLKKLCKDLKL